MFALRKHPRTRLTPSRPRPMCRLWALRALPIVLASIAVAQTPTPTAPATPPPRPAPDALPQIVIKPPQTAGKFKVSRRALAKAYVDLERQVVGAAEHTPPETIAAINRGFDSATDSFFVGDYSTAVKIIHEQQMKLYTGRLGPMLDQYDFVLDRRYVPVGAVTEIKVRVASMYPTPAKPDPRTATFGATCQRGGGGQVPLTLPDADGSVVETTLLIRPKSTGECALTFGPLGSAVNVSTPIRATSVPLERMQRGFLTRIGAIPNADARLMPAINACRSRIMLLTDSPSETNSAEFMPRLDELAAVIPNELEHLERGQDPYTGVAGDFWLTFDVGGAPVPMRLYKPDRPVIDPGEAMPLVIALHGAGGDENLWADGYGGGIMVALAQREGFVLVAPQAPITAAFEGFFDAIVDAASRWQRIDKTRIYVVGHSMGGGVAAAWAKSRTNQIAAVCTIAGIGQFRGTRSLPPTLIIAGELDPLITPAIAKRDADAAKAAGLPIEYREIANYGHTLVVAKAAPQVVDWLLKHKLSPPPATPLPTPAAQPPTEPTPAKP